MTSRWKSGQRRYQGTFVVARRRLGRPGRRSAGSSLPRGKVQASGPQHEAKPAASISPLREETNWEPSLGAADEGHGRGEDLEQQPPRTQRRRGRGTLAQPSWEQERPVSAPAVRPGGCHPLGGLGAPSPISRRTVKWARAERESERRIVLVISWQQNHEGGKAPHLVCASDGGKRW